MSKKYTIPLKSTCFVCPTQQKTSTNVSDVKKLAYRLNTPIVTKTVISLRLQFLGDEITF